MVEPDDLAEFGLELTKAFKAHLEQKTAEFVKKIADLESTISSLPVPKDGVSPDLPDFDPILDDKVAKKVAEIVAALPPAEPGKDAVLPDIEAIVAEHIKSLSESLPVAKDGVSVSIDDVLPVLSAELKSLVETIPAPEPGKDGISPELPDIEEIVQKAVDAKKIKVQKQASSEIVAEVLPVLRDELKSLVADIPSGKDGSNGTSVSVDDVLPALRDELKAMVEAIPEAAPGKSVEIDDVLPALMDELKSLVSAIPAPVPGKDGISPELPDIEAMVKAAADKIVIPDPKDGVSPELPDIEAMVKKAVGEIVIPAPKDGEDGKSIDIEEVKSVLAEMFAAVPIPKDGEDGKSVDPAELEAIIDSAVAKAIQAPVEPDLSTLEPVLADMVQKAVATIPTPVDGSSVTVEDVTPLLAELVDKAVAKIPAAKDGVGLASALIDNNGEFIVTMTDGRHQSLGKAIGKSESAPMPDFSDVYVSDDLAEMTSKAIRLLVETPAIQPDTTDIKSMPTINITVPVTTPKPGKKQTTVTKWTADGLAEQMVSEELDVEGA